MPDNLHRASPLRSFPPAVILSGRAEAGVVLTERAFCGHVNLRGNPNDAAFLAGVQRCCGVALPIQPNTVSASANITALWLGPDEWLLVSAPSTEQQLVSSLQDALRGLRFAVTNITDGQTVLHLQGKSAIDVLRKGCSLDFHPRVFKPGHCAQTLVAKAGALIHYIDQSPSLDLIVRRSFAEYLALWLKDAATEYGFRMV
jgi:sarcosine oxidase, subunit gamma